MGFSRLPMPQTSLLKMRKRELNTGQRGKGTMQLRGRLQGSLQWPSLMVKPFRELLRTKTHCICIIVSQADVLSKVLC